MMMFFSVLSETEKAYYTYPFRIPLNTQGSVSSATATIPGAQGGACSVALQPAIGMPTDTVVTSDVSSLPAPSTVGPRQSARDEQRAVRGPGQFDRLASRGERVALQYTHTHTHTCVCVCVCVCVCLCACDTHTNAHSQAHTHKHTNTHTHKQIHKHTHTHAYVCSHSKHFCVCT